MQRFYSTPQRLVALSFRCHSFILKSAFAFGYFQVASQDRAWQLEPPTCAVDSMLKSAFVFGYFQAASLDRA